MDKGCFYRSKIKWQAVSHFHKKLLHTKLFVNGFFEMVFEVRKGSLQKRKKERRQNPAVACFSLLSDHLIWIFFYTFLFGKAYSLSFWTPAPLNQSYILIGPAMLTNVIELLLGDFCDNRYYWKRICVLKATVYQISTDAQIAAEPLVLHRHVLYIYVKLNIYIHRCIHIHMYILAYVYICIYIQ